MKSSKKYVTFGLESTCVEKSELGSQLESEKIISKPFSNRFQTVKKKQSRPCGSVVRPSGSVWVHADGSADFGELRGEDLGEG